jgi:predicted dithiol-disulfide oxidoreductase (DUF899 family)
MTDFAARHRIVPREEWLLVRQDLLAREKEFTRLRDEDALAFTMSWVRHHDRYGDGYTIDPKATYVAPKGSDDCCG